MYIHLTNFSVNKKGDVPQDYPPGCQVNKWTIYELWDYMRDVDGVDPTPFWDGVKDVVIKTLLCGHENIDRMVKESVSSFYNNFNLLGLDIFIDTDLRPYLLEVNTIPSLFINQVSKEIDTNLKAPLISEVFNICGHHVSSGLAAKYKSEIIQSHLPEFKGSNLGYDHRLYCNVPSEEEKIKQSRICRKYFQEDELDNESNANIENKAENNDSEILDDNDEGDDGDVSEYETDSNFSSEAASSHSSKPSAIHMPQNGRIPSDILDELTPCDLRVLIHSEEELAQTRTFERIFPRTDTEPYLDLMTSNNYYDVLLAAWENAYVGCREEGLRRLRQLSEKKVHLEVPDSEKKIKMPHKSPLPFKRNLKVPHIFNKN